MSFHNFITELKSSLPSVIVENVEAYKRDWWLLLLLQEPNYPLLVLKPTNIDDLIKIINLANKHSIPLVPYSGGTSVVGGSYHNNNVILDLSNINKIIEFNEEDLLVTVESGIKIEELEKWLNKRGYTLDYHPGSFYLATIGGSIAHKGSGSHSSSNIEELVTSLEVLLPNGELINVGYTSNIRSSMGPNLAEIFIGSEGIYGIITKATLRVKPLANSFRDIAIIFPSFLNAIDFAREFTIRLPAPHRIVIHDEDSGRLMLNLDNSIALIRIRRHDQKLVDCESEIVIDLAKKFNGKEVSADLVRKWRDVFARGYEEQLRKLTESGLIVDTIDSASTWSRIRKIHKELKMELSSIRGVKGVYSRLTHVYSNGASLYTVVIMEQSQEVYWNMWEKASEIIINNKGTTSHHHGVGLLKRRWLDKEIGKQSILLNEIKRLVDKNNILNPGKLI